MIKHYPSKLLFSAALILCLFFSCKKEGSLIETGIAMVYMPTSVSGFYNVPMNGASEGAVNFTIDSITNMVNIPLSVYLSGRQPLDGFSVEVGLNKDTVTQLIGAGALPGVAVLSSAAISVTDKVNIRKGQNHALFSVSVRLDSLKRYEGGKVALAVSISNPSKYVLNNNITTTIVVLEVDPVLYGPLRTLTSKYLKNAGPVFDITDDSPPKGQCNGYQQTPTGWKVNDAVKIFEYNGQLFGGVDARCYGNRDYLSANNYDFYTTLSILNGKISQTFVLPKGKYQIVEDPGDVIGGPGHAYMTIAKGDSLPDFADVPTKSMVYTDMATATSMSLVLSEDTAVTFGFVYNFRVGDQCSFAIKSVSMIGRVGGD